MKDTEKLALIYQNLTPERQQKITDLIIKLLLEQAGENRRQVFIESLNLTAGRQRKDLIRND